MADNPYRGLPSHRFWSSAVAGVPPFALDPMVEPAFRIASRDRVATAGSCFAQHISRRLSEAGFTFHVTERAPDKLNAEEAAECGYGVFSARYGNIYTAKQLVQLFDRAFGAFTPAIAVWSGKDGGFVDPFRPTIQKAGFASVEELEADRQRHLAAVRELFLSLDVFVFTLGLTEGWRHAGDDAALPVAPGVAGGEWVRDQYVFANSRVGDVIEELSGFVDRLRSVNQAARVVLTVSPVPLVATYEDRHVLVSTTYSKSVLRVAAEEVCARHPSVAYFPAYEIVTSQATGGRYFADDLRSVNEIGVDHVMRVFFRHFGAEEATAMSPVDFRREIADVGSIVCDEDLLDPAR